MTWIDTGGRLQLRYDHEIVPYDAIVSGRVTKYPLFRLSLVSWLGISGGETTWDDLGDEDAEPVAKLLAKLISHFMNVAPKLLEGLSPDD
jgi:hypothetical protein